MDRIEGVQPRQLEAPVKKCESCEHWDRRVPGNIGICFELKTAYREHLWTKPDFYCAAFRGRVTIREKGTK